MMPVLGRRFAAMSMPDGLKGVTDRRLGKRERSLDYLYIRDLVILIWFFSFCILIERLLVVEFNFNIGCRLCRGDKDGILDYVG